MTPGTTRREEATEEPQALVVTHWFDSGESGEPYRAVVRFSGHRAGVRGKPGPGDSFVQDEVVDPVVPGSGPVSVTAWIYNVNAGEWAVAADLVSPLDAADDHSRGDRSRAGRPRALAPAAWSWRRWSLSAGTSRVARTRWAPTAPLARLPAVVPGSVPALVALGTVVTLALQAAILAHEGEPVTTSLLVSVAAAIAGLVAAKLWYAVLHPGEPILRPGWAVDGFFVVTPVAAIVALLALNLPVGVFLDASAPGLFFAVAVGRVGCFLTGCCAGRCTRSKWGIWSSDRRVGARRIPTQLLESAAGLLIGAASLPLALVHVPFHGLVFVAAFGVYAAIRQGLLRLRAEQRAFRRSLPLTAAAAAVVMLAVVAVLVAYPKHPPVMAQVPSAQSSAASE